VQGRLLGIPRLLFGRHLLSHRNLLDGLIRRLCYHFRHASMQIRKGQPSGNGVGGRRLHIHNGTLLLLCGRGRKLNSLGQAVVTVGFAILGR